MGFIGLWWLSISSFKVPGFRGSGLRVGFRVLGLGNSRVLVLLGLWLQVFGASGVSPRKRKGPPQKGKPEPTERPS